MKHSTSTDVQVKEGESVNRKKTIAKDSVKFFGGHVGSRLVQVLRTLVVPKLVSPTQYGLWRLLMVVWQYGLFMHLGSLALMNRELPGLTATQSLQDAKEIRQSAFWGTMLVSAIAIVGFWIWSFLQGTGWTIEQIWSLRIIAVGILFQQIVTYHQVIFRTRFQFGRMSLTTLSNMLLGFILAALFALKWGVIGLAAGTAIAAAIVSFGAIRWSTVDRPTFKIRRFWRIVQDGFPLSGLLLLRTAILNLGPIVAAWLIGLKQAGYYGIGMAFGAIVFAIPHTLGMVLYPRFLESLAKVRDPKRVANILGKALQVTAVTSPLAVCMGIILTEPIFQYWLPKFLPATDATRIQLVMMVFVAYPFLLHNTALALRKHWAMIAIHAGALVLNFALMTTGALLYGDASGIAFGALAANTIFGLVVLMVALHWTGDTAKSIIRKIFKHLLYASLFGLVTYGAMCISWERGDLFTDLGWTLVRLVCVGVVGLPMLAMTWKVAKGSTMKNK